MKSKPNIVILVIDCFRACELYHNKGRKLNVPFLNKLSKVSYTYRRAIAPSTWTLPSCASILSGLLPTEHNLNFANSRLKTSIHTLPELLNKLGYRTACFTANPLFTYQNGLARGFDEIYNIYEQPIENSLPFKENVINLQEIELPKNFGEYIHVLRKFSRQGNFIKNIINAIIYFNKSSLGLFKKDKGAQKIKSKISEWLELRQLSINDPFFLYIHFMELHEWYYPLISYNLCYSLLNIHKMVKYIKEVRKVHFTSRNLLENYQYSEKSIEYLRELYRRELEYLDKVVCELYKEINSYGENVFVVTADHGQQLYEHNILGHSMKFYNVNLHVPLIIKTVEEHQRFIDRFVSLKDLPKTLLDYLRLDMNFPGYSFLPEKIHNYPSCVFSETIADPILDLRIRNPKQYELRGYSLKSILESMFGGLSVYYKNYHYIFLTNGKVEIYDFEKDYFEKENLYGNIKIPNELLNNIKTKYLKIKTANAGRKKIIGRRDKI